MLLASAVRLLLVDDDQSLVVAMKRLLAASEPEWEIMIAIDGQQALELMKEHEFAVVITDLDMPRGDGSTLLRHAQEYHPGTV
ncbi:MAG TPA: response regulator, partial [Polyangiaceae bacterium]|nr:response regulator [Polyangiaceae bacterium]